MITIYHGCDQHGDFHQDCQDCVDAVALQQSIEQEDVYQDQEGEDQDVQDVENQEYTDVMEYFNPDTDNR